MEKRIPRVFAFLLTLTLTFSLVSCASPSQSPSPSSKEAVNIGCTASIGSLNPVLISGVFSDYYAISLQYLPLVALDANADFEYMLADSISSEDNLTYTIHLNEEATWSDGTPITSEDLVFTMTRLTSSVIANPSMMLQALVGTDDETGYRPEGMDTLEGVKALDDKTVTFTFKNPINLLSFLNGYAQYIVPMPAHVLADVPDAELASYDWFTHPDVVSGPYRATSFNNNHYVTYTANESYWRGPVNIPNANIKIVDGAGLYAGLQSGEIDLVPPLLGTIETEDYENIKAMPHVTSMHGTSYSVENIFINTTVVDNRSLRQAMRMALNRDQMVSGLLDGNGTYADGFAVPDGPYWQEVTPTPYDVEGARTLVEKAIQEGWNPKTRYTLYANSGDSQLVLALQLAQQAWNAVGIRVDLKLVDINTLMGLAAKEDTAMVALQYTYPPADPSWDVKFVLDSWCHDLPDAVTEQLDTLWSTNDPEVYAQALRTVDLYVQESAPMIDLYITGPLGAVSNRLQGAVPTMYGSINQIHTWTLSH